MILWRRTTHSGPPLGCLPKYAPKMHIWPYLAYLGAYMSAPNMVKRGVPENILQNAVQKRSNCPLDCAPLGLTARPNLVALDSSYLLAWISLVKLGFLYSSYIRWIFSFFPFLQSIKSEHMHTSQHLVDHWQWSRSPELSMKSYHTQSAPSSAHSAHRVLLVFSPL